MALSHINKLSYGLARSRTPEAAAILLRVLRALQLQGNNIHAIVAHSMGARFALAALSQTPQQLPLHDMQLLRPVSYLYLLAAAVSSNALHAEFPLQSLFAKHVINIHSRNDDVLADGFSLGETLAAGSIWGALFGTKVVALGLMGATMMAVNGCKDELLTGATIMAVDHCKDELLTVTNESPHDIDLPSSSPQRHVVSDLQIKSAEVSGTVFVSIDASSSVLNHSIHVYLSSPEFCNHIISSLLN